MSTERSRLTIGTWNMEGKARPRHLDLLRGADADVWLLTEVCNTFELEGLTVVRSEAMGPAKSFAAVVGVDLRQATTPHAGSAAATAEGVLFVSSVLPWRGAIGDPWVGLDVGERTANALLGMTGLGGREIVWGGDWNHALKGHERAGSKTGRAHIERTLGALGLRALTASLPHRLGEGSIDHIAVPRAWTVERVERVPAVGLSDHDAYVATVTPAAR